LFKAQKFMPKVDLYNQLGATAGTVELDDKIFNVQPHRGLIEQAIVTILANRRQPLAHTKTRGDVRGGGIKPWRQKGTGRARQGSIRSPQWKGGGVVHGPKSNRNYTLKMNTESRRKALKMSLTDKLQGKHLVVVDKIQLAAAKTKEFSKVLKALPKAKKTMIVLPTTNVELVKAGRNIPGITFIRADSLNTYDVVRHEQLLILQEALPVISKTYTAK
jgi:large subunit ribosomal protein L4